MLVNSRNIIQVNNDLSKNPEALQKANQILLGWLVEACQSEASRKQYTNDLAQFGRFLATVNKTIFDITRYDVQAYMEFLKQQNLSASTRSKKLTVIKGLLKQLAIDGAFPYIDAEKIAEIRAPKVSRDERTPGLSREVHNPN